MVKLEENQTQNGGFEKPTHPNNQIQTDQKPESGIIKTIGQLLPLAPFLFEQFTGQKVPQMSGTIAEMQTALLQIQSSLQVVVQNQQALVQRISQLETNATSHLTNLTHQFNSLRLTHTREKKEIAYNQPTSENQAESY